MRSSGENWINLIVGDVLTNYSLLVLIADILVYFTGVAAYWSSTTSVLSIRDKSIGAFFMLMYPGLILIDHGHFQYVLILHIG